MHIKYKLFILPILLSIWTTTIWAQTPQTTWELKTDESSATKNYVARESIKLQQGSTTNFHYKATTGKSFSAKIDAGLLFPPTTNTYATSDGTITTDPTKGGIVGSIPGQFGVGASGGASYTIPIECPAGINGMQPNVSLAYNSQGGNGIAGWGWSLSGMSSIGRTGSNLYNDGKTGVPQLTTDDNLTLDGQRLILVSGAKLTDGAKYRTEIETYSDITYKSINGYVCFEVKTKEGVTMEFGSTANSYIHASGSTVAITWLLNKVTDANGNYMTYSYGNDTNNEEFWLDKINYTCNDAAGITTGANEIDFNYSTGRADSQTSYIAGTKIKQSQLLTTIVTKTNSVAQRTYSFTYSIADGFYNKLTQVDEKGNDGTKYNPTVIDWNKLNSTTTPDFGYTTSNTGVGSLNNYTLDKSMIFADFNNDGFVDVIRPKMGLLRDWVYVGWEIYQSVNGQSFTTTPVQQEDWRYTHPFSGHYQLLPTDINGDGLPDIVEIQNSTDESSHTSSGNIDVLLNVNGTLVRQNLQRAISGVAYETFSFEMGDFNGDGTPELIAKRINGSTNTIDMYSIDLNTKELTKLCSTDVSGGELAKSTTTDVNGNGLPELYIPTSGKSKFVEYDSVTSSFKEITFTHSLSYSLSLVELEFGDFNGDGKTDVLRYSASSTPKWTVLISTGTGFETTSCPITRSKTYRFEDTDPEDYYSIKDLNGDGKGDIIEAPVGSSKVNIYYYNGSGFIATSHLIPDGASTFFNDRTLPYYDINGDGKSDIVNTTSTSFSILSFSTPETERSVSTITNGMGITNTITYKLLNDTSVYTNGTSTVAQPVVKLCIPMQVVSQAIANAGSNTETTNYTYKGLILHTKGKGILGFEEFTQDNITQNKKSISQFGYNTTYFNVYPTQQTVSTSSDQLISTTTFVPGVIPIGLTSDHRYFPYTASQTTTDNLTGLSSITETSNFDSYGNPQTIVTTKGTAADTKIVETSTGTYIQKGSWCPNKVSTLSSSKLVNGQISTRTSQYTFDSNGNIATEIMDPTDENSVTTTYQNYDNFGHCQLVTKTANSLSRSTSSTYTTSGRFLLSKTNSLGETTSYSWDETKGQLDSETNRFGTTYYTHNGFGSVVETKLPDGIRNAQVLQWASPSNTIGAKYYSYTETSGSSPVTIWHDALGHEIQKDSYGLNNKKISVSTEYYTENNFKAGKHKGMVYRISDPYFESDAASKTWANTYTYDDYGRLSTLTTPLGLSSSSYNGKTITGTTPDGSSETTVNDAGQTIVYKVNGKAVNYTYYPSGQTKTSTPEGGQTITSEYNLQGKRTKLIDPDGGTVETKYNGFGELTEEKQKVHDATNYITTTKNYDALKGMPLSIVRNGETTSYTYDTSNRVSIIEISGKNKQTFTYDGFDRITNVKEEIGSRVYNTAKEYDVLGRVKKEIFPSGIYTVNSYDSYGHLVEVKDNASRSIWKANAENARHQLTSINKGVKETTFGFDSRGLPTSIVASGVENMSYSFDTKGNLSYRTDNLTNQNEQFTYDSMNRLTNWDIYKNSVLAKQNSITFDATTSNITSKSDLGTFTMSYGGKRPDGTDIGPHALATISGVPTSFPTANLNVTYTDFKKIATLSEGTKYYALTYGVDEQRSKSEYYANGLSQGTPTLTKYYLGNYEEEINALGNVRKIHYLSGGAMLIQNNGVDSLLYGYSDFQGSLIALTDENGTVVEKYAYDPWGARRNADDWTQKDLRTSWITSRGYTGHEHIDAFGVINMNGRVYDPATAMFMSPDPYIQSPKDWLNYNRYSYCMNNPFKYTDPSGKFWLFRLITGAVGLIMDVISIPLKVIRTVAGLISGDQGVWKSNWGKDSWSCGSMWNLGKGIDESIFGKSNKDKDAITGQPGSSGTIIYTSDGQKVTKFNTLQEMVNYMDYTTNCDKTNNPEHVEMVGYQLDNGDGTHTFYVLDWSGNTQIHSKNPYKTEAFGSTYNGKLIMAEFHTHPASYSVGLNRPNAYDGPSWEDQQAANDLGVPVYSIGAHSVSVIKPGGQRTKEDFKELGKLNYKKYDGLGSSQSLGFGSSGSQTFTTSELRGVNPYAIAETNAWLSSPTY